MVVVGIVVDGIVVAVVARGGSGSAVALVVRWEMPMWAASVGLYIEMTKERS